MSTTYFPLFIFFTHRYFHGKITREVSKQRLSPWKEGKFLIRECIRYRGDYTLNVCTNDKVESIRIVKHKSGVFLHKAHRKTGSKMVFKTLHQLVTVGVYWTSWELGFESFFYLFACLTFASCCCCFFFFTQKKLK